MKRNLFIVISVLFVVVLMAAYFIFSGKNINPEVMTNKEMAAYADATNKRLKEMVEQSDKVMQTKEFKLLEAQRSKQLGKIFDAQSKYITFYGKVIDQYGQPVSGAQVVYVAAALGDATGRSTTRTNEAGVFLIDDARGARLSIREIITPGYQVDVPYSTRFFAYKESSTAMFWTDHVTPETAYVFEAWKIEGGYPRVKRPGQTFGFRLTPDGRTTTFHLLKPDANFYSKGFDPDGNFTLSCLNENGTWSATLEFIDGGFIESDDVYMNLAPEHGYRKSVTYEFPIDGKYIAKKHYYIRLDSETYGKMDIEYRAEDGRGGKARIYLNYVVNLENGRSLVVKSD